MTCHCGHSEEEHSDPRYPGSTACIECRPAHTDAPYECLAYEEDDGAEEV